MEKSEAVGLEIQVSIADATKEELDRVTRQLLSEIRELDVESVELASNEKAPIGSKGDPITIGSLAVDLLPSVLPTVIALIQAWRTRGKGRIVKFKSKGIEFEGSPEELQELLAFLDSQKRKRK